MKLAWKRDAQKALLTMQPKRAMDIRETCRAISADPPPRGQHPNLKPLRGVQGGFRVRFGDWRVSFTIDRATDTMEVFEVAPRGGAYR